MPGFNVRIGADPAQLQQLKELLSPQQFAQAEYQAIARTTRKIETQVKKIVKEETYIRPKYVNRVIDSKVVSGEHPEGIVTIKQQPLPLVAYKISASKRGGVTAYVSKDRGPLIFRHGFLAQVFSAEQGEGGGHAGVFTRSKHLPTKGPGASGFRSYRRHGKTYRTRIKLTPEGRAGSLAIEELRGPSVLDIVSRETILDRITLDAEAELVKQMNSQLDRFTRPKFTVAA